MNVEYRKIFNKNYAIISDYNIAEYKECYRSKMLKNNKLNNFLIYDTQSINGTIHFTYDISSKQTVYSFYENSDIDYETVRHLMMSLKSALDVLNNYLLEPDFIILDPKMIYMNVATKSIYFCYCPGEKNNFYESLNSFLCYILSKINHDDNNSIILAYSLQQQSTNKNYTFDDLIEILNKPVFQQKNNHINQKEEQNKEQSSSFSASECTDKADCDFIRTKTDYDSLSGLSKQLSKKNLKFTSDSCFKGLTLAPVCIFLISLGIILYYGIVLQAISSQRMILFFAASAFICLNLFTFIKNRQTKKEKTAAKNFGHEMSASFAGKSPSSGDSAYSDPLEQEASYSDIPYQNILHTDNAYSNNTYSNNTHPDILHKNELYSDALHQNELYSDTSRQSDLHSNILRQNNPPYNNLYQNSFYSEDLRQKIPSSDALHQNIPHSDTGYPNTSYSDTPYQNTQSQKAVKTETSYYEDTVILGYRRNENMPRLVYTGTDFTSENELTNFPFIIGKMAENVNMVIDHPMISRIHAKIYLKENHYYIEDMNSSNGTYINNTLIQPHSLAEISTGDYITFSHLTYIFQ